MEGRLEDFPTFFSVCENIAWTRRGDVIGWPPDSRGTWVVFAFSGSAHHLPETEVANRCEFRNGLGFGGGIEKALTKSAGCRGIWNAFRAGRMSLVHPILGLRRRESRCYAWRRGAWSGRRGGPCLTIARQAVVTQGIPKWTRSGEGFHHRGESSDNLSGHESPIRVSAQRSISGSHAAHWTSARVEWSTTRGKVLTEAN